MKLTKIEKENLRELEPIRYRKDLNNIPINRNEDLIHLLAKVKLCHYFKKKDENTVCEGYLTNNRGRVDVFNLSKSVIYEVMQSEKYESIEIKRTKYPCIVIALKAEDVLKATDEELEKML